MRILVTLSWLVLVLEANVLRAQEEQQVGEYLGSSGCFDCHEEPSGAAKARGTIKFIELTEAEDWVKKDKHARAFSNILETKLGRDMLDVLNIKQDGLAQASQCTSCHSNPHWVAKKGANEDPNTKYKESGVTCESCHGGSSLWDTRHRSVEWRLRPPVAPDGMRRDFRHPDATKKDFGMTNVRDPEQRASLCFSCHIGDVSKNRIVTHEMYAAGHPPLPSIELETFLEKMPRHWRTMEEKQGTQFLHDAAFYDVNRVTQTEYRRLESVVMSAAVAFQTSVRMIKQQAENSMEPGGPAWPELALFDCYSCHHDLKLPSWRQVRANEVLGYRLRPGRPQLLYWPTTLLPLSGSLDRVDAKLVNVGKELDRRPFGDAGQIALAAGGVVDEVGVLVQSLQGVSLKEGDVDRLLLQLCQQAESPTVDYESARQIGWAFVVVLEQYRPAIQEKSADLLERLAIQLRLDLPWGQDEKIDEQLPAALETVSDFEPEAFRAVMSELRRALGQ